MKKIIIPVLLMVTAAVSIHCEADDPTTLNAAANDSTAVGVNDSIITDTIVADTTITDTIITDTTWIPVDSTLTPVDSVITDTTWIPETPVDTTVTPVDSITARKRYKRVR